MEIYFRITKGPRKDDVFKVGPGISLGRSKADVNLKDAKTSSIHGVVELQRGLLVFSDGGSTNGTFQNGARVSEVILKPGVFFKIGSTEIEVVTELSLKKSSAIELSEWRESLYFLVSNLQTIQNPQNVYAFKSPLLVRILSGILRGKEYILGYGPRTLGGGDSDIFIAGEQAPLVRFAQKDSSILIEDLSKNSSLVLSDRLNLQLDELLIEVSLINEANS